MFEPFAKMPRLSRPIVVTEKIDGTNAQVHIVETMDPALPEYDAAIIKRPIPETFGRYEVLFAGSRTRYITPEADNFGFAAWAKSNADALFTLGPGRHFGEWWGLGIQRRYGLTEKRFSLFNTHRWGDATVRPACCSVVPVLYQGLFDMHEIDACLHLLETEGSVAAPGFTDPEGIVIYHEAAGIAFKKTLKHDEVPKALAGTA